MGVGQFRTNFHVIGDVPANPFRLQYSYKETSSEVQFYTENGCFAFLSPLRGFVTTFDVHLTLFGIKHLVDYFSQ